MTHKISIRTTSFEHLILYLRLYVPRSCRDGQFTIPHFFPGQLAIELDLAVNQYFVHILSLVADNKKEVSTIRNHLLQTNTEEEPQNIYSNSTYMQLFTADDFRRRYFHVHFCAKRYVLINWNNSSRMALLNVDFRIKPSAVTHFPRRLLQ